MECGCCSWSILGGSSQLRVQPGVFKAVALRCQAFPGVRRWASSNPFCWGPFAASCWHLVTLLAAACSGELTAQPAAELGGPGVVLAEVWHQHETG